MPGIKSVLRVTLLGLALVASACAHQKPPPPAPAPPPPPPPPAGDLLRLKAQPGAVTHGQVHVAVETDVAGAQGGHSASRHLELGFDFTDEEKVQAVAPDGTQTITAELLNAVGHAGPGTKQETIDNVALALDEVKVRFQRTTRGEVDALQISGVRPPLEEQTARTMLNALYLAQRGPLLDDKPVPVGGTWKVSTSLPPSSGFTGVVSYLYTYLRDSSGVSMIGCDGTVDGKGGGGGTTQQMKGTSTASVRFERESGNLLSSTVDATVQLTQVVPAQQAIQSGVRQHVRAEWRRVEEDHDKPGNYVIVPGAEDAPAGAPANP
jgi:hypothetical protein